MRQLLATIVLGSILAATVPAAFAKDNHADKGVPAFEPVTLDTDPDVAMAGASTQPNWEHYYRMQNRGK